MLSGSIHDLLSGLQKLKASQSLPINCKGPESEAHSGGWTPDLKSDLMNTAFCGAEVSTTSGKAACLMKFYLLTFFCNNKFIAGFTYFCFWNNFL